jgi:tetratricopeptide (TPR) repeat protein
MTDESAETSAPRRTKQAVAVLLMVVTVIAGVFGVSSERTSDEHVDATRAVEVTSVRMLDERARAAGRISAEQQAENTAAEQRANAEALARLDRGDIDLEVERRAALEAARGAEESSRLGPEHSVLRDTSGVVERFKQRERRGYRRGFEFANAYDQQRRQLAEKADSLLAVTAVLAIALFLIGLTLAVGSAPARKVLLGTGVALACAVTVWGVIVASGDVEGPSAPAIDAYLRGQENRRVAFAEISGGAERDPAARALMRKAITDFDQAIRLRPDYGAAYSGRAIANDVLAFTDPRGSHGSPEARDDYQRAYDLDHDRPLMLNNLAVTELRLGDYDAAVKAARGALALRPRLSNYLETLTSVLRYQSAQPTPAYRAALARLRAAWARTETKRRNIEMVRAIEGTEELEEQDPRLAAKARSYRADLRRIEKELSRR